MRPAIVIACIAASVASTVAIVQADPLRNPVDARALEHLKLGNRHLDLERYDDAIAQYEAGALIDPVPVFWLNIGLAHRKAGRHADAVRAYRTFLMKIQDDPDGGELRAQVEEIIRALEDAATKPPTEPAPSAIAEPTQEGQWKARAVTSSRAGMPAARKVAVGLGAGGIVALGAGAYFGYRAAGLEDDAAALCPRTTCERADEANALIDRAERNDVYATIAIGVGTAAVVGAAVLYPLHGPRPSTAPRVMAAWRRDDGNPLSA